MLWILIGYPVASISAAIFIGKCIGFGMGTLPTKAQKQVVLDVFDGRKI